MGEGDIHFFIIAMSVVADCRPRWNDYPIAKINIAFEIRATPYFVQFDIAGAAMRLFLQLLFRREIVLNHGYADYQTS